MMHVVSQRIWLKCIVYPLTYQKNAFKCPCFYFTLQSRTKLNIHYRGSPWGSRTQQHAYCLHYAHSQHIESHLGKKKLQAKVAIAFVFSQLHFNNVTSHALFYGGHLVMRSKRCAVQNQGITLSIIYYFYISLMITLKPMYVMYHLL